MKEKYNFVLLWHIWFLKCVFENTCRAEEHEEHEGIGGYGDNGPIDCQQLWSLNSYEFVLVRVMRRQSQ